MINHMMTNLISDMIEVIEIGNALI